MAQLNLLCCKFNETAVAIPHDRVIGVVEGGPLTPLPFSSAAFEGLVEAIGQVVPQIDLARVLGQTQPTGGFLIVVTDASGSLALRVQQVNSMIEIDSESALKSNADTSVEHPLFKAAFTHGNETLHVLDIERLSQSDVVDALVPSGEAMLASADKPESTSTEISAASISFLLTEIGAEHYAFASGDVLELNNPGNIRFMPGTPDWVLGLIDLRGTPILALSTSRLLGKELSAGRETCLIAELENGPQVALFIDKALGLERFAPDNVYAMEQPMGGVREYLVLDPDRIVGVIDPLKLVEPMEKELRAMAPTSAEVIELDSIPHESDPAESTQQMLTVRIGAETFGLTLERITRIQAGVRLTPLPSELKYFDGMADVGDGIVPVIDLRKQVAPPAQSDKDGSADSASSGEHPPCLLTMLEGAMTGLLVDQVLSIREFPSASFEAVKDGYKLPVSHVVNAGGTLVAVLKIDCLFPAV